MTAADIFPNATPAQLAEMERLAGIMAALREEGRTWSPSFFAANAKFNALSNAGR